MCVGHSLLQSYLHVITEKIHRMTRGRERKTGTPEQEAEVLTTYRNVHKKCLTPSDRT